MDAPSDPATVRPRGAIVAAVVALVVVALAVGARGVYLRTRLPIAVVVTTPAAPAGDAPAAPRPTITAPTRGPGDQALAGVVVDGAGLAVEGVGVTAIPEVAGPDAVAVVAVTERDGQFTLEGLAAGRYRLALEGDAIFRSEVRFVPVPADPVRLVAARRIALAGVVGDVGGAVAGATVAVDGDSTYGVRTATTDARGRFTVDELPEGSYRVWAWTADRAARAVRVPRLGPGPFADVVLELESAAVARGRVVDRQTGAGIAAAVTLTAEADDEAPRYLRTSDDGRFASPPLPPGRWTASAWAPGWILASSVDFTAGRGELVLELLPGGVVEGVVVDEAGAPVVGAQVAAVGRGASAIVVSAAAAEVDLRRALGLALAPATALAVTGGDAQLLPRGELGVMVGPIPFAPPPGASRTTVATLTDDRAPAVDATAAVTPIPADPAYRPYWTTDNDGRFRLTGIPAGGFVITAEASGYAPGRARPITIALGQVLTGVRIRLERGVTVVGRVTDQRGAAVVGAIVTLAPADAPPGHGAVDVITDADGNYRAGPLTGKVAVTARAWGHGDHASTLDLSRAPPGEPRELRHDLTLVVADAQLEGTVEDPGGLPVIGARVVVDGGPADGRAVIAGAGGRFRLEMLPAGALGVRVEHSDYPPQRFAATTDQPARLRLAYGGGFDLLILDHHTGAAIGGVPAVVTGPDKVRRDVASDGSGHIVVVPIAAGAWTVAVRTPGYVAATARLEVPAGDRGRVVTARDQRLELERGATVAGTVRDRSGDRVASAAVTIRRGDVTVAGKSDSLGEFRLVDAPTGAVTLTAERGGKTVTVELELRPGDERGGVDLTFP